jgi:hypothetical protein
VAEVAEDPQRPARVLRAGLEVERMETPEGVGDIERARLLVDRAGADDAVAVELLAGRGELADVRTPTEAAVGGERRHLAGGRRRVVGAAAGRRCGRRAAGRSRAKRSPAPGSAASPARARPLPYVVQLVAGGVAAAAAFRQSTSAPATTTIPLTAAHLRERS